jgi:biopolymer transport protein ExbD
MRQQEETYLSGNLTAMIDVVFQLIIFFVCTVNMQDTAIDTSIRLAMAPYGQEVKIKNPLEINIDVDNDGHLSIARTRLSEPVLVDVLRKAAGENGAQNVPVIIRGDSKTKHEYIRVAMDACVKARIWKIKFAALKERGT